MCFHKKDGNFQDFSALICSFPSDPFFSFPFIANYHFTDSSLTNDSYKSNFFLKMICFFLDYFTLLP